MDKKNKQVKLTLIRSISGRLPGHKECVNGLGIRRIHQTVIVDDNPCNRGMINKVSYLLDIQEV